MIGYAAVILPNLIEICRILYSGNQIASKDRLKIFYP